MKNSRPLNLVCIILGIYGGYQCVAQLSVSQAVVFFLLLATTFSCDATPCVLKMLKWAQNYLGHSKRTVVVLCDKEIYTTHMYMYISTYACTCIYM